MRFAIIDRGDENSRSLAAKLLHILETRNWICDPDHPELVLCIGGDGTLLRAIHEYMDQLDTVAFLGIHTGTLGFFTDYTEDEIEQMLLDLEGTPEIEESRLVEAYFPEDGSRCLALNEIRIESASRTLALSISIDGEFFERTNGSGVCISTQAGSTAINRALNGAVIDSGLSVLQLAEIMPIAHKNHHTLRNPYIMKDDRTILLEASSLSDVICSYDHLARNLDGLSRIVLRMSERKVRFARYRPYSYLKRLKNLY